MEIVDEFLFGGERIGQDAIARAPGNGVEKAIRGHDDVGDAEIEDRGDEIIGVIGAGLGLQCRSETVEQKVITGGRFEREDHVVMLHIERRITEIPIERESGIQGLQDDGERAIVEEKAVLDGVEFRADN